MNENQHGAQRLFHLTFYKCGSQWVRDMLADPRITACTGFHLAAGGIDLPSATWPELHRGEMASPLYSVGTGEWHRTAQPGDQAFVVIRDPRDIVVSLVFSISLSHTPSPITQLLRDPIARAEPADRLKFGMFLFAQWEQYLRSWRHAGMLPNVHATRYESLLTDLPGELRRLFAFLQWPVPETVIDAVAADNTFEKRSGRQPGDENEFSHRRKGIAGDWRNHFDRKLGEHFENAFPSLLTELGYEGSDSWWQELPERIVYSRADADRRQARLLAVLEEHESELAELRTAAAERLRDVELLHTYLHEQTTAASQRLEGIVALNQRVRELERELELARQG